MKPCKTFLLIVLLLLCRSGFAQSPEYGFINYRQSEGLPSNECYYIYRDSKNYLWFATDQGVVRFSGKTMERFELPDNIIFKIREDAAGRIWFFSQTGKLSYFYHEKVYPYRFNDNIKKSVFGLLITDAFVRKDSSIHINAIGNDNYEISPSGEVKNLKYSIGVYKPNVIFKITDKPDNFFAEKLVFDPDPKDSLYLQFENGKRDTTYKFLFKQKSANHYSWAKDNYQNIYFYNSRFLIRLFPDGRCELKIFDHDILCINTEDGDDIWVGFSDKGAVRLDRNFVQKDAAFFPQQTVSSIVRDYEKGMWFSTLTNGVYYIKDFHLKKLIDNKNADKPVFRVFNQKDSILYFVNGEGIHYRHRDSIATLQELHMLNCGDLFIRDKTVVIGASGLSDAFMLNSEYKINTSKLNKNNLNTLIGVGTSYEVPAVNDSQYFINHFSSLSTFTYHKELKEDVRTLLNNVNVKHIWNSGNPFISSDKKIWINARKGLFTVRGIADTPTVFPYHNSLFEKGTTCMRQLGDGTYVIGLRFGGVVLMKDTTILGVITEKEGLLNNSVKYILIDGNNIWAATAEGISVIGINSLKSLNYRIRNFGQNKGLFNVVIYQLTKYQNTVIAAASNGIYSLDYAGEPLFPIADSLYLEINKISCYKFDTVNINRLSLPYNKSRLSVKYNAICFNAPEQVVFSYRLLPTDTSWKTIDGNELILENLQPGDYHVQVRAEIENQQRISTIESLDLTIEKPWWQTNIFRLSTLLLLLFIIYAIYKLRINSIRKADKKEADTRLQLSGLEQKALRSQMNPHFIFNCLTSIQQLIISGKNDEANLYLVRFSKLIRSTLENSATPFVSIAKEEEYITDYVILEQLRFPEEFDFSFITDHKIDKENCLIPGMIIQPIVENSIRHGFKNTTVKGKISIEVKLNGDFIECSVSDNGGGYDSDRRTGQYQSYALKNIRQRLEILNDLTHEKDINMDINNITDNKGKTAGTIVRFKLPVIKNKISAE